MGDGVAAGGGEGVVWGTGRARARASAAVRRRPLRLHHTAAAAARRRGSDRRDGDGRARRSEKTRDDRRQRATIEDARDDRRKRATIEDSARRSRRRARLADAEDGDDAAAVGGGHRRVGRAVHAVVHDVLLRDGRLRRVHLATPRPPPRRRDPSSPSRSSPRVAAGWNGAGQR